MRQPLACLVATLELLVTARFSRRTVARLSTLRSERPGYLIQVGRTGSERIGRQRVSLTVLTGLMWRLDRAECGCKCHRRVARKVDQKRTAKCFALGFALVDAMGTWQVGAA